VPASSNIFSITFATDTAAKQVVPLDASWVAASGPHVRIGTFARIRDHRGGDRVGEHELGREFENRSTDQAGHPSTLADGVRV